MTDASLNALVIIMAAATAAPFLVDHVSRWVLIPSVVVEIMLGIAIGPAGFGWATDTEFVSAIADFGLAVLMFLAGYEIEFHRIRGRPLNRAAIGWGLSLALGLGAGLALHGVDIGSMAIGLALTTTALGTILPIAGDAGLLPKPFGARLLAVGAIGEFGPIVAIALLLTSTHPLRTGLLIVAFALVGGLAAWRASRPRAPRLARMVSATLGTSIQLAVRLAMLLVMVMVWFAGELGLDVLLGAFAAGVVLRLFLDTGAPEETEVVDSKLIAIGFGFLIPIFFVHSGMAFDLRALVSSPAALAMVPAFLLLFLLVRGLPTVLLNRDLPRGEQRSLVMFSATALPLVVVITTIGRDAGEIKSETAAALVGAGMLSVLIFPLLALRFARTEGASEPEEAPVPSFEQLR